MTNVSVQAAPPSWGLPPLRPGTPASEEVKALRGQRFGNIEASPEVQVSHSTLGNVPCVICDPHDSAGTMVYFHGGAYWRGYADMWIPLASRIAAAAGVRIVVPDYALAPEEPFPAALHDAARVFTDALTQDDDVVVAGDSAGGGLAAALVAAAIGAAVRRPAALVLISPWLDLTGTAPSHTVNRDRDTVFSPESAKRGADFYLRGADPRDPLASPIFCDPTGFPPTLVMCGSEEILLDDSLSFAQSLAAAAVDVDLHIAAGMQHVWPLLEPESAQAAVAVQRISRHVRRLLDR